jgi:hypothetical protein
MRILNIKKVSISIIIILIVILAYILYKTSNAQAKNYANSLVAAINNQNCQELSPIKGMKNMGDDKICPRGDVGNFMVIDKVSYEIKGVLGGMFKKQILLNVCIGVRGEAAWNYGGYSDCTTDPRIVNITFNGINWIPNQNDFDNISYLMNTSGKQPADFDQFRTNCSNVAAQDILESIDPSNPDCIEVGSDIIYTIQTHNFVQTGHAH